jgi:hypothetical protein
MSDKLKFIPTSMIDIESSPKSIGDVIYNNTGAKILLTENSMERRPAPQEDDIDGEFEAAMNNPKP